jgi:capsule polysaccharide export protein KpsE/RkpR
MVLADRESSLTPWFKQVERELSASGEHDAHPELAKSLEEWKARGGDAKAAEESPLLKEKRKIEKEIQLLKKKFAAGEIESSKDEEIYNDLLKDLEKKLIEIEAEMDG